MVTTTYHALIQKTVLVIKGCNAFGIPKNIKGRIVSVTLLGAEYSHAVKVVIEFKGRHHSFTARHINRLSDPAFNLNKGNPLEKITVRPCEGLPTGIVRSA